MLSLHDWLYMSFANESITYNASQEETVHSVFSTVPYAPQPDKKDAQNRFSFTCYNDLFFIQPADTRQISSVTCCSSIFCALSCSCCRSRSSLCFWRSEAFWFKSSSCLTKCSSNSLISSSVYAWFCSRVWGHPKTQENYYLENMKVNMPLFTFFTHSLL